jgi:hypothetical protein
MAATTKSGTQVAQPVKVSYKLDSSNNKVIKTAFVLDERVDLV